MRKPFTLYTFTVTPHVPSYPAELATRVGSFTIQATGDRTIEEVTEAANAVIPCDPCESPFLRGEDLYGEPMQSPLDAFRLVPGGEVRMWGGAALAATVRAVEVGAVTRSVPPEVDPGDFDFELMQELVAEEAELHGRPRADPTPSEIYRVIADGAVLDRQTDRAFRLNHVMRWEGELTLAVFPAWVEVFTDRAVPKRAGRLVVETRDGPRELRCSAFDELTSTRLGDIDPEPIDLLPGGRPGPTGVVLTHLLGNGRRGRHAGVVRFTVVGNGEYWKYRDRFNARSGGPKNPNGE